MTMAELERRVALQIAGRYHQRAHRGMHAIPAQQWAKSVRRKRPPLVTDRARIVIDFLPAVSRRVGRNSFRIHRIRYWAYPLSPIFHRARGL